ncbi:MAG: hypothetical protein ACOC05_02385 [Oceanicaulis sp.]
MLRLAMMGAAGVLALGACGPQPGEDASETTAEAAGAQTAAAESAEPDEAAPQAGARFSEDGTRIAYTVPQDEWPHHAETSAEITAEDFAYRIATLADDRFGGRGPASDKGEPAADWIATEMQTAGLRPAGVDGTWFQPVPLIESTLQEDQSSYEITVNGEPMGLQVGGDVTYWSQNPEESVSLEASDLVFVG